MVGAAIEGSQDSVLASGAAWVTGAVTARLFWKLHRTLGPGQTDRRQSMDPCSRPDESFRSGGRSGDLDKNNLNVKQI
jgi:hypothetical protein